MKRSAPETIVMLQESALHVKTHSDEVKVIEKNIKTKRIDTAKKRTHNK